MPYGYYARTLHSQNVMELECLPYSVGHADDGVCLLMRIGPYRVLLDCGLKDISPLQREVTPGVLSPGYETLPLPADLVLISHAHSDHARGLLALHRAFPQLPIYGSEVTTQLLPLNWPDIESSQMPLFCQALPWRSRLEFRDGLTAELFPAGHLPGAAAVLLTYTAPHASGVPPRPYTVLYTGDFFLSNSRLVEGLPLEDLRGLRPDVLIVEGSYGTARYPHRRSQENHLAERVHRAIAQGYSVLLPTPALGLGQELLMLLRSHHHFTGRDVDIWVDGTVAAGCDAYLEILPQLPTSVQNFARHQPLFWDERVRPRVRRLSSEQLHLVGKSPSIVLTDEISALENYCHSDRGSWLVLLPEHPGHLGDEEIGKWGEGLRGIGEHSSAITVETYLLAQHSDGNGTTQLIHNLHPDHVIFVHGSPTYLADLTNLEELRNKFHLHYPSAGMLVELPIGETILQPAVPEKSYEGEVTELESQVTITLPDAIASDPRWHHFADTGLVEARWYGEELVLRGLSQRELLSEGTDARVPAEIDCCGNCRYYVGQRCRNPASPLFGQGKVAADAYCLAFERANAPPFSPDFSDEE